MDANETPCKLTFERLKRFLDEVATVGVHHAHVFLIRHEIADVTYRDQLQFVMEARAQVFAAGGDAALLTNVGQDFIGESRSPFKGLREPLAAHGLQHIPDGIGFEGFYGVFVIGGGEYHGRRGIALVQVMRGLYAIHARHAYVQENDVRFFLADQVQRFATVASFANDLVLASVIDQLSKPVSRGGLVIDDQYFHYAESSNGKRRRTR